MANTSSRTMLDWGRGAAGAVRSLPMVIELYSGWLRMAIFCASHH